MNRLLQMNEQELRIAVVSTNRCDFPLNYLLGARVPKTDLLVVCGKSPLCPAVSTGRCNTGFKFLCWCLVLQGFSWPLV